MKRVDAISPDEALHTEVMVVVNKVITSVNNLLASKYTGTPLTILQSDILGNIDDRVSPDEPRPSFTSDEVQTALSEVNIAFGLAGWKVTRNAGPPVSYTFTAV